VDKIFDKGGARLRWEVRALKQEREKLIQSFVRDIRERQERGLVPKTSIQNIHVAAFCSKLLPSGIAAATRTMTGLDPNDPELKGAGVSSCENWQEGSKPVQNNRNKQEGSK